jgi:mRNA-degrading endonuclease RelE of RelBE toxin-antitoxin system
MAISFPGQRCGEPSANYRHHESAAKTFAAVDSRARKRMKEKIEAVAADPLNPANSKPLQGSLKRSARVGDYRMIVEIAEPDLLVVSIRPRGDVYRNL